MKLYIYILKMIFAIAIAIAVGYFSYPYVLNGLLDVKEISIAVLGVFVIGLLYDLIRLHWVNSKAIWVNTYRSHNKVAATSVREAPKGLSYVSNILRSSKGKLTLEEYYNAVKALDMLFSHNKDAGKFFVKLCFMTGFLGAFLCVMMAVSAIGNIFTDMNFDIESSVDALSELQRGLSNPLQTLNTAFALAFLGIYLSCLLSYIDRQSFMSENKFLIYVENWLLLCTNQKNK
jgi:hypothetical protein